jgi:hypothetical protein
LIARSRRIDRARRGRRDCEGGHERGHSIESVTPDELQRRASALFEG